MNLVETLPKENVIKGRLGLDLVGIAIFPLWITRFYSCLLPASYIDRSNRIFYEELKLLLHSQSKNN